MFKKIPYAQNDLKDLTAEQVKEAKTLFGKVYKITVEDKKCFLHPPTRQSLDLATESSRKKSSKFNETILKNCWLAGDKEIVDDDVYFLSASTQLDQIIEFKESSLEEL